MRILRPVLLLACFALLTVASNGHSMTWLNELIPRKVLVEPVLLMDLEPGSPEAQTAMIQFKYSGRYSGNLILRRAHSAVPPRDKGGTIGDIEHFDLQGRIEIRDRDGKLLMVREFEKEIFKNSTGLKLFEFDTDEVGMKGDKIFSIQFERTDARFSEYFHSTELYIRKELKHSLFD